MWHCCSSEPIFEAPQRYNDAAPMDFESLSTPKLIWTLASGGCGAGHVVLWRAMAGQNYLLKTS